MMTELSYTHIDSPVGSLLVAEDDDALHRSNVQSINPSAKQTLHDLDSETLVRGKDRYNHYKPDIFSNSPMDPTAFEAHAALEKLRKETWAQA